jgi:hypothetical protein
MTHPQNPPNTIGELIDEVERIREDLLRLQRELEKLETVETALCDEQKEAQRGTIAPHGEAQSTSHEVDWNNPRCSSLHHLRS